MKRWTFISGIAFGLLAAPLTVGAQQPRKAGGAFAGEGGLMGYGPIRAEMDRRVALG